MTRLFHRFTAAALVVSLLPITASAQRERSVPTDSPLPGQDTSPAAVVGRLLRRAAERDSARQGESEAIKKLQESLAGQKLPPEVEKLARDPDKLRELLANPTIRKMAEQFARSMPQLPNNLDPAKSPIPGLRRPPEKPSETPTTSPRRPTTAAPTTARPQTERPPSPVTRPTPNVPEPWRLTDPRVGPQPNTPTPSTSAERTPSTRPSPVPAAPDTRPQPQQPDTPTPGVPQPGQPPAQRPGTPPSINPDTVPRGNPSDQDRFGEFLRQALERLPEGSLGPGQTVPRPSERDQPGRGEQPAPNPDSPRAQTPDTPKPAPQSAPAAETANKPPDPARDAARQLGEKLLERGTFTDPERLKRVFEEAMRAAQAKKTDPAGGPDLSGPLDKLRDLLDSRAGTDASAGVQRFLRRLAESSSQRSALPGFAPRLPDVPQLALPALAAPTAGGVTAGSGGLLIAAVAVVILVALLVLSPDLRRKVLGALGVRTGPAWPIDPRNVRTREDLIRAFEHLSVVQVGERARQLNHRAIAGELGGADDRRRDTAGSLAAAYEGARYAPSAQQPGPAEIADARRHLLELAGNDPA